MPPGRRIPRPPDTPPDRPPPPEASDAGVSPEVAKAAGELASLAARIRSCEQCGPAEAPRVYGTGYPRAAVMLVKGSPSAEDLETGNAFAAEAVALTKAFEALSMPAAWMYGTSAIKSADAKPCAAHLLTEIEAVRPRVLIAFGADAVGALRSLDGRCGLRFPEDLAQASPMQVRGDLALIATEPLPAGVTERDAKRRLWRDLQVVPKLIAQ